MDTELPLLDVSQLACTRNERCLFEQLTFSVQSGQMLQIAGPNGAGKSSLLRLLAGLARPDDGEVRWQRQPLADCLETYRRDLVYLGHQPGVKGELTPLESLTFYAPWTDESDRYAILETVGLVGHEDIPAAQLSAGQQRRIALARLFAASQLPEPPKLWILDEPLTAIDKQGVAELEHCFLRHIHQGGAIVLTTHQDLGFAGDHCRVLNLSQYVPAPAAMYLPADQYPEAAGA